MIYVKCIKAYEYTDPIEEGVRDLQENPMSQKCIAVTTYDDNEKYGWWHQ